MQKYITCDKCSSDEFIRIMSIPLGQGQRPKIEERKLACHKCGDELTADEINKALRK